jgi:hypothetical protein
MCHRNGVVVKRKDGLTTIYPVRCKSWQCEDCAQWRYRKMRAEIYEGRPERFITLTVNPLWFDSPETRCGELIAAWRGFVREWNRKHKSARIEYYAVIEKTERGEPHMHVLQRGPFIPFKLLSAWMAKKIGAPRVRIEVPKTRKGVARYVTKYCSKGLHQFGNHKRYLRSLRWLKETVKERKKRFNEGATFYLLDYRYSTYCHWLEREGYNLVSYSDSKCVLEHPPWEDNLRGTLCAEGLTAR